MLTEFYLDGCGSEIAPGLFATLDLKSFSVYAMHGMGDWLAESVELPGPDISRLASHFLTNFGRRTHHWVADSMNAQRVGSGVEQAPKGRLKAAEPPAAPDSVQPPSSGLDDTFLRGVAANYAWAIRSHRPPAPTIAAQAQCSVRTVHAWIRKARERGILEPTKQGRVG